MSGHDELSGDRVTPWLNTTSDFVYPMSAPANDADFNPRGVVTDEQLAAMAERNRQRAAEAARRLGTTYVLHPVHRPRHRHVSGVLR